MRRSGFDLLPDPDPRSDGREHFPPASAQGLGKMIHAALFSVFGVLANFLAPIHNPERSLFQQLEQSHILILKAGFSERNRKKRNETSREKAKGRKKRKKPPKETMPPPITGGYPIQASASFATLREHPLSAASLCRWAASTKQKPRASHSYSGLRNPPS